MVKSKRPIKIGITGGIGAGKSLVCSLFELLGIPVYYADIEAKRIMVTNENVISEIKDLFGEEVYNADGSLNKVHLGGIVFKDQSKLQELNQIVHPAVHKDLISWFAAQYSPYAIEEAALIIEAGNTDFFDEIILVSAPKELRISRVMKRNNISRDQVIDRINKQTSEQFKRKHVSWEIVNDEQHSLIKQVLKVHNYLLEKENYTLSEM